MADHVLIDNSLRVEILVSLAPEDSLVMCLQNPMTGRTDLAIQPPICLHSLAMGAPNHELVPTQMCKVHQKQIAREKSKTIRVAH